MNVVDLVSPAPLMADRQLLIIKIYQYLQKLARNFVRTVKYTFDTYILEVKENCDDKDLIKLADSRLTGETAVTVICDEESERDPLPIVDISTLAFDVPVPCDLITDDVAKFILSKVHKGDCFTSTGWLNDDCINYYLEYILKPLSLELQQNIKFLTTH